MATITVEQAFQMATANHRAGRLGEAQALYRQILAVHPRHAESLHALGLIAAANDRPGDAASLITNAIAQAPQHPIYHANLAEMFRRLGRFDEAVATLRRAIELGADAPLNHFNLGMAYTGLHCFEEAVASFQRAVALQPDYVEAHINLGVALDRLGRTEEAIENFRRGIALSPGNAEAHNNLGAALVKLGRTEEGVASTRQALALRPRDADAHYNLGVMLGKLGQFDEAIASYRRAIALRPADASAHHNLGVALADGRRFEEAIASYQRVLALQPDHAQAHANLALALIGAKRFDDAIRVIRQTLARRPNHAAAHRNLGSALSGARRYDEAIASYRRALEIEPESGEGWASLGHLLLGLGNWDEALAACRRAVAINPNLGVAHMNLAILLLLRGQFAEGWKEYEWRSGSPSVPSPLPNASIPQWDGAPAPGQRILLHTEQGFGDTIQFLRYFPRMRARAGGTRIVLGCPRELQRLVAWNVETDVEIASRLKWDNATLPPFDQHLSLLSLPLILGLFEPLPMTDPYLCAEPGLRATWRQRLGTPASLRVGVAWAGSRSNPHDAERSIGLDRFEPILRVPDVSFYSLQIGAEDTTPRQLEATGVKDHTSEIKDFADTAALVSELDLIISVDTAVVHLAGALGRPVWTLVPFVPDWRWGFEREDTPWYPTMRLFRQHTRGDWDSVLERVADELRAARR